MRLYIIKFVIDSVIIHIKQFVGICIMLILTMILVGTMLLMNCMNRNRRTDVNEMLRSDTRKTGYFLFNNFNGDVLQCKQAVSAIPGVAALGNWQYETDIDTCFGKLEAVQGANVILPEAIEDNCVEKIILDYGAWDILSLNLQEGLNPKDLKIDKAQYVPIYLGDAYKDCVNVGDILIVENSKNKSYYIAGILSSGCIPSENLPWLDQYSIASGYSLDYEILCLTEDDYFNQFYFTVKDGYDYSAVVKEINITAEKYKITAQCRNIGAVIDEAERKLKPINHNLLQMIIVIGLTTCIIFTCFQTTTVILRKSEYGIFYACGLNTGDLLCMIAAENILKFILSLLIALPVTLIIINHIFPVSYGERLILYNIVVRNVAWRLAILGMCMTVLSSLLPLYTLKKYSPVSLIGGNLT